VRLAALHSPPMLWRARGTCDESRGPGDDREHRRAAAIHALVRWSSQQLLAVRAFAAIFGGLHKRLGRIIENLVRSGVSRYLRIRPKPLLINFRQRLRSLRGK
jgi:hypothetical protein